ncbi:MAG TPA: PhzF family phenazine biosynthesis protein [Solirubrobacterales bacterium]|nr:PhzF family phenazine biosynthesis protein [Solirubrobacterales bacterium]
MPRLHVLRVFTGEDGRFGNPLGVFLDGPAVPADRRQTVATALGFSETVFVDDLEAAACRIFTPGLELSFAGHPMVGTAWLLEHEGRSAAALQPPAGEIEVRREGELTFVAARAEWSPPWKLIRLEQAAAVESLVDPAPKDGLLPYYWSWEDEAAGTVRSRCFSLEDIGEDEATGSAAIMLCAQLGRELTISQGEGSLLYARPLAEDRAEVGGRVVLDEVRELVV